MIEIKHACSLRLAVERAADTGSRCTSFARESLVDIPCNQQRRGKFPGKELGAYYLLKTSPAVNRCPEDNESSFLGIFR